jgi:hypothetical protein
MRSRLALAFQLGSLALTGWILWGARLWTHGSRISLFDILFRSTVYALAACCAGALITMVLCLVSAREWERDDLLRATLGASRAAIWFAPAIILFTALSPAAVGAAAVLVVSATRLIYHEWRLSRPPKPPNYAPQGPFAWAHLPPPHFWRDAAPSLIASLSFQCAGAAMLLRQPLLAGAAFALTLAVGTVVFTGRNSPAHRAPESLPRSFLGVLLTLVLAIGLTVGGMLPGLMHGDGSGFGFGSGGGAADRPGQAPPARRPMADGGMRDRPDLSKFPEASFSDNGFPGVILWPEVKPYATLIAPMPQRSDGLGTVEAKPMSIPFSGEYWMYRWPFAKPPRTSYFQRGSPVNLSFRTTDRRSLQMEARHKLSQEIALDCCRAIELAIHNSDRFPDTVTLELVLIDNEHGERSVSLGRQQVISAEAQTLSFPVPTSAEIRAFDEFRIVFVRDRRRADQSAKVSVERFILQPRL